MNDLFKLAFNDVFCSNFWNIPSKKMYTAVLENLKKLVERTKYSIQ